MSDYDDIIDLPHHRSKTRPQISAADRAAQFSPFAALKGYEESIEETARVTEEAPELDEARMEEINGILLRLGERISRKPRVRATAFLPDARKEGGSFRVVEGAVEAIFPGRLVLDGGEEIAFSSLVDLSALDEE